MKKSSMELKVGAFVFIGLIGLGLSIIMLGGDRSLFKSHYRLHVEFDQVQGLAIGSIASLTGINVGNVDKMTFIPEHNKLRVTLKIDETYKERLREGTMAEIRTQGALGDKYIYLIPGQLSAGVLKDNDEIKAVNGGDFIAMISSKADSIERVFDIINEIHVLMKSINGDGRSEKVMENMTMATHSLRNTMNGVQGLIEDIRGNNDDRSELRKSVKHLSNILRKIDQGEGTLGALINDPTLHENLKTVFGGSPRQRYLKTLARDAIQNTERKDR